MLPSSNRSIAARRRGESRGAQSVIAAVSATSCDRIVATSCSLCQVTLCHLAQGLGKVQAHDPGAAPLDDPRLACRLRRRGVYCRRLGRAGRQQHRVRLRQERALRTRAQVLQRLHRGRAVALLPVEPALQARPQLARLSERTASHRRLRRQDRRLRAGELPHPHARGRTALRRSGTPDDRSVARLPAAHEQRELLGGIRARAADLSRAADRRALPGPGGGSVRSCGDALPEVQLRPRLRARVYAALRRAASVRASRLPPARKGQRGRLRGRRLPRLLDRGLGPRRYAPACEPDYVAPRPLRERSGRVRARLLVSGASRASAGEAAPNADERPRRMQRSQGHPARRVRHGRGRRQLGGSIHADGHLQRDASD